jgi:hypothetical protein
MKKVTTGSNWSKMATSDYRIACDMTETNFRIEEQNVIIAEDEEGGSPWLVAVVSDSAPGSDPEDGIDADIMGMSKLLLRSVIEAATKECERSYLKSRIRSENTYTISAAQYISEYWSNYLPPYLMLPFADAGLIGENGELTIKTW